MSKSRKIDADELNKRVYDGRLTIDKHPFLNIYIYNYTRRTQNEKLWDEYTRLARGLIIDRDSNLLANPFPKFFNLGDSEETMIQNLPQEVPVIMEKLDGMLGILYSEKDKPAISTRGKFNSPYAEWATDWIRSKGYSLEDFRPNYTYLFEIVYPENKIIVDYGNRAELVLLAVRNNYNDYELDYKKEAEELGFSYAQEFFSENISGIDKINDALQYLEKTKGTKYEGFICKYSNGFRIKIKSTDYRRLSKILTGISARDIWSSLKDTGSVEQIIENTPDEFDDWVKKVENELNTSKTDIMNKASIIFKEAKKLPNRVEQSAYIINHTKNTKGIRGIIFALLDHKIDKAERIAWKIIEPPGEIFKRTKD